MILSILVGVFSSVFASLLFIFLLSRLKPRVLISSIIAKDKDMNGDDIYVIKTINKTKAAIINCEIRLELVKEKLTSSGEKFREINEISMNTNKRMSIEKYTKKGKYHRIQYRTYENLDETWNDDTNSFIRLRLYAVHSFSGFGKVFTQDYFIKKKTIKEGSFEFANNFNVE